MPNLDKRLQDLERKAASPKEIVIYQESLEPGERGMFRRGAGWRGREDKPPLLRHDELERDAGPNALCITIIYQTAPPAPGD